MTQLKTGQLQYASSEQLDQNAHVFYWDGGVYRGVAPTMAPVYRELFERGSVAPLIAKGLVPTEIATLDVEGYDLVLKHERIPFVAFPTEWSGMMLKDAALLTLDMSEQLDQIGMELQDAHPWNILFDGTDPRFIDFGSIVPKAKIDRWRAFDQFIGTFINPLLLMSVGLAREARALLVDPATKRGRNVTRSDVVRTMLQHKRWRGLPAALLSRVPSNGPNRGATLAALRRIVSDIQVPLEATRWSDYCDEEVDLGTIKSWMVKRRVALQVLQRTRPQTLLDIGSNTGWFSKLAAGQGARVVAFDVDEPSINKLYMNAEARRLKVLPLAMDFRFPTPAYGVSLRCAPAVERFQCEMVFALAIVHHLVFGQKEKFSRIVEYLAKYSTKSLLVEFIPKEDKHVAKMYNDSFSWYTLDNFIVELKRFYTTVEVLPSNPDPRVLLLCQR